MTVDLDPERPTAVGAERITVPVSCSVCGAGSHTDIPEPLYSRRYVIATANRLARYQCPELGHGQPRN